MNYTSVSPLQHGVELLNNIKKMINEDQSISLRSDFIEYMNTIMENLEIMIQRDKNPDAEIILNKFIDSLYKVRFATIYPPNNPTILNFVSIKYLKGLEELYLDQIPPSSIYEIYCQRLNLKKLIIINSGVTNIGDSLLSTKCRKFRRSLTPLVFTESMVKSIPAKYSWMNLTNLILSNCGLVRIDEGLHFFPQLKYLNLSHNQISNITHLYDCICLENINLGYNRIRVLSNLERCIGRIKILNLSHNEIESLDGLDKIYSLEKINLSHNNINDIHEVQHISKLPNLESIYLFHNPISEKKHYRLRVYREFLHVGALMSGNRAFPSIDHRPITRKELKKLRRLMFRAPENNMVESSFVNPDYLNYDLDDFYYDELEEDFEEDDELLNSPQRTSSAGGDIDYSIYPSRESIGNIINDVKHHITRSRSVSPMEDRSQRKSTGRSLSTSNSTSNLNAKRMSFDSAMSSVQQSESKNGETRQRRSRSTTRQSSVGNMSAPDFRDSIASTLRRSGRFIPIRSRKKRYAMIGNDEIAEYFPSLEEIKQDIQTHGNEWFRKDSVSSFGASIESDSKRGESEPGKSPLSVSFSNTPSSFPKEDNNGLIETKYAFENNPMHNNGDGSASEREPSILSPNESSSLQAPSMDDFIGKISERTEFRGYTVLPLHASDPTGLESNVIAHMQQRHMSNSTSNSSNSNPGGRRMKSEIYPSSYGSNNGNYIAYSRASNDLDFHKLDDRPMLSNTSVDKSMLDMVDPYVGDDQFRHLSIVDNLELFLREQVFSTKRPCYPQFYLHFNSSASSEVGSYSPSKDIPGNSLDYSMQFLSPFSPDEKFITMFVEKIIDLKAKFPSESEVLFNLEPDKDEYRVDEREVAILMTDQGFYLLFIKDIPTTKVFADAPLLTISYAYPLYKLSVCTIYFGFQRCALQFYHDPFDKNNTAITSMSHPNVLGAFIIITRDKSRTYPIITKIPQLANVQRQAKGLTNVRIENKDSELLEQALKYISRYTTNSDIVYYQMVYRYWQKKPGLRTPRSIILTQSMILLASEQLTSIKVELIILESYLLKDIYKIFYEDNNPLQLVIQFKKSNVLLSKKKWRIYIESHNAAIKLMEECRRACLDVGNGEIN